MGRGSWAVCECISIGRARCDKHGERRRWLQQTCAHRLGLARARCRGGQTAGVAAAVKQQGRTGDCVGVVRVSAAQPLHEDHRDGDEESHHLGRGHSDESRGAWVSGRGTK